MRSGLLLAAAATLFWVSWILMPGVGVTDPEQIFKLVGTHRPMVMISVIMQLASAVLYVPAMLGIATDATLAGLRGLRLWSGVLIIGAMGSAADAVLHLLAYAMTAPGLETAPLIRVMAFMQGPGLFLLAPLILCFFIGGIGLSVALWRGRVVSPWNLGLHAMALAIAVFGGLLASRNILDSRAVGLAVLGAISAAQAWAGLRMTGSTRGLPLI